MKKINVVLRTKGRRGTFVDTKQFTLEELKKQFPYWDGKTKLLKADARLGITTDRDWETTLIFFMI